MASAIDPIKPVDGVPSVKVDLRNNLQAAKAEIEALQAGKADVGHQHVLGDVTDAGALAARNVVQAGDIAAGAVTATELAGAAVTTARLADAAVTAVKLADAAVTAVKLADAAVSTAKLADAAVTSAKLADAAVIAATLADSAVTTAKLTNAAVSTAKLADAAVTSAKLADAAVIAATLADGAVTTAKLANAAVTGAQLADAAVSEAKLADTAVTSAKLATAAVTTAKLADGSVSQAKLATSAVGAAQLQDGIPINMLDQLLIRAQLKDFSETSTTPAISAGALTLDLETGNVFEVALTQNVTTLNLANPPATGRAGSVTLILRQDATGGRTLAWPTSVHWAGGGAPAISNAANAVDILALVTRNAGTTWYGFLAGKDFS